MSSPESFLSPASSPHSTPSKMPSTPKYHQRQLQQQQLQQQQLQLEQDQELQHQQHQQQTDQQLELQLQQQDAQAASANGSPMANATNNKPKHHPTNLPYDPLVHTANKPPLSFSSLIFLAIDDSVDKALPVKEIYAWIVAHYPYFKTAPTGWKNSVRHNLSLNKCFQKVEKAPVSRNRERESLKIGCLINALCIFLNSPEYGQRIAVAR